MNPMDPGTDLSPAPLPTKAEVVGVSYEDGTRGVLLRFSTPAGVGYYFLEPEGAAEFGKRVVDIAEPPTSTIIVPTQPRLITG